MFHSKFIGFLRKPGVVLAILGLSLVFAYWFCLPEILFSEPESLVLLDKNKKILSARIASDGQWRFPYTPQVPEKFKQAIICFEDKRFYNHPGVDPAAMMRAMKLNIENQEVVSGGSTLSMQVIRLSRKNKDRSFREKLIEMIMATRLEIKYSKEEILALYASNAPFGGNVVGLETASWKYFGREASQLSWGETATLAVLPNSPGLIHPGRNRNSLKKKRDYLLDKMKEQGIIDSTTCYLSKAEELPERPLPLPNLAPHLIERFHKETHSTAIIHSTIDINIQKYTQNIVDKHSNTLKESSIHNAAALVMDTESGNILAYIGNSSETKKNHGQAVDLVNAKRSTGSILKPLLYAMMLHEGSMLPHTLVPDIPTYYGSFTPKNFDLDYDGALPASIALARSLNIPASRMLNQYGIEKFHRNLKSLGMTTLDKNPRHYGLSMILGGAETTLEEIAGIYAGMGRTLKNFEIYHGKYDAYCFRKPNYLANNIYLTDKKNLRDNSLMDAASIWHAFESMSEVVRPDMENNWQSFNSSSKIAWKTGTSFGSRDGWAIGCTPQYTIAVWVGNADGEGRPELTGISCAAPILFDILNGLKKQNTWFQKPLKNMEEVLVCKKSGHRATDICAETEIQMVSKAGLKSSPCPYHKLIHLDESGTWQVHDACYSPAEMITKSYFVLPPAMELFYKSKNPDYISLPKFKGECSAEKKDNKEIQMIYPSHNSRIYIPVNLDNTLSKVVFQASHANHETIMYWHIDDEYFGETKDRHEIAVSPHKGKHSLTIITNDGEMLKQNFEVVENKVN